MKRLCFKVNSKWYKIIPSYIYLLSLFFWYIDLEHYYGKDRLAEITDEKNITPAVASYVKALKDASEKNPALLIAHSYSRYLGDLSGNVFYD